MTTSPPVKGTNFITAEKLSTAKRNPRIEDFNFPDGLPTADELPDSDGKPVDNELQELIPGLLKAILMDIWKERRNWLFGIDMGFYFDPSKPYAGIAPDALLSLGVADPPSENLRSSFVLWQEKVIPLFAIEIVSKTAGGEKNKKFEIYQSVGILYYLVYSPLLKRKAKFQLYKLIAGEYVLQSSGQQPYWMPEIGLAIGSEKRIYGGIEREWLYWYDENAVRYPTPLERIETEANKAKLEAQRAESEAQRAESEAQRAASEMSARIAAEQRINDLLERMRKLGIDPPEGD
jgi:Uma2 family endonuclease